MQHARRPLPSLHRLAIATLIKWRECLGDLGSAPVELLHDVLASCSPALLAEIEDCTLKGSGRVLSPWLWPHWRKIYVAAFGEPPAGTLPALPAAVDVAVGPPGIAPANYRLAYERRQAELEQKRAESGKRLRQLREQEEAQRKLRHAVVVDAQPARRRQRQSPGSSQPLRSVPGSSGQQAGRVLGDPKSRLLKKLGLGGGSMQASASSRGRQAVPSRTYIRPPPAQPMPATPASQHMADHLQQQRFSGGTTNQQQQRPQQQQTVPAARHASNSVAAAPQQRKNVQDRIREAARRDQTAAQVSRLPLASDLDVLFIQQPKARQQLVGGSSGTPQASLGRQLPKQPPLLQGMHAIAQPRARPPSQPLVECDVFAEAQQPEHVRQLVEGQPAKPPPQVQREQGAAGVSGGLRAAPASSQLLQSRGQRQVAGGSGGRQAGPFSPAPARLGQKRAAGGGGGDKKRLKPALPAQLEEVDIFDF